MAPTGISDKMMELVARRFRTLGEPYRLRLLQMLQAGEMSVGDLVSGLDGNQSNVSKHMQILHEAGLVARRRAGTTVLYSISDPLVFKLCDLVCQSEAAKMRHELEQLNPQKPAKAKR
jgi:DNA-binding transcriptional ArsR family regulator